MNKTYLIIILIVFSLFASQCSNKNVDVQPFLTIENKDFKLSSEASTINVNIKSSSRNLKIEVKDKAKSWISHSFNRGIITLDIKENQEVGIRKAEISVELQGIKDIITVEQLGQEPAILLSKDKYDLEQGGGTIDIEVISNVEYKIEIPDGVDWVKKKNNETRSEMLSNVSQYEVGSNLRQEARTAYLVVKQVGGKLEKKVQITQEKYTVYTVANTDGFKDDIKLKVTGGTASSYHSGENIDKSFDGDKKTIYHSNWNNNGANYFPIRLQYDFGGNDDMDYFVYYPRQNGYNGRFEKVEIWISTKSKPNFVKLIDYDFKGSPNPTRVNFKDRIKSVKSIRFIINSGFGDGQGFASCAEMEFYKINPDNFSPLDIFTDYTCSELKAGISIDDINKINDEFYKNIAYYIYVGKYPSEFRIQEYKAWPHPDVFARENKIGQYSLLDNPTGISVDEAEDMIIFVGDTKGYSIQIKVQNLDKPGGDGYGNASYYPLVAGLNKIKVDRKGLIYVLYHTPNYEAAPKIKIHFATGEVNGYFDLAKHSKSDWQRLLYAAKDKYFDLVGKKAHLTFPTSSFKQYAKYNGDELIKAYDDLVQNEQEFMGLMKYNRKLVNRAYFHVMYHSFMYATSYRTAYNVSTVSGILDVNVLKKSPWGPAHELGHIHQTRPGFKWHGTTEVTTNVHSLFIQTSWGNASRIQTEDMGEFRNRYEKAYYNSFIKGITHPEEKDVFCKLVCLWQLQVYFAEAKGYADFYKDFYEILRTRDDEKTPGLQQLNFVKLVSEVGNLDMVDFFRKWGMLSPVDAEIDDYGKRQFVITQDDIDKTISDIKSKNYPTTSDRIEYICDANWKVFRDKGSIIKGSATYNESQFRMTGWKNVVAYEVWRGDKLIHVSNLPSFKLKDKDGGFDKVYAISFDGKKILVDF